MENFRILHMLFLLFSYMRTSTSLDSLALTQSIKDGETLVSSGGTFEAGFFILRASSPNRYFGIWFRNVSPLTIVWVANRETPLQNNTGVLKVNKNGVLVLIVKGTNNNIWSSSNLSSKAVNNPIAKLFDSGNLVVKNGNDSEVDQFLWQSFDYPCDTFLLRGMKFGWNLVTGQEIFLSSWKSKDDPAKGEYTQRIDPMGYPQLFKFKGSVKKFRIGSWNGVGFSGYPTHQLAHLYAFKFVLNEKQVYFECQVFDKSIILTYTLTPLGHGKISIWTGKTSTWKVISTGEGDECENYALCGAYSICSMDGTVPVCKCLKGYVPKSPEQWNISDWSNGCVPRNKSNDHLVVNGNDKKKLVGIIVGVIGFGLSTCVCIMIHIKRGEARTIYKKHYENILRKEDTDLQTFDLPIIAKATGNFSSTNKLGEGGFGPVYKVTLVDGRELAVKRLSEKSAQGWEEFKNEMVLIAKLQHRNLVKLHGYCIQGEEIMLIYEYMPNKSLDYFIFGLSLYLSCNLRLCYLYL